MFALLIVVGLVASFLAGAVASLFRLPRSLVFRWLSEHNLTAVRRSELVQFAAIFGLMDASTLKSGFLSELSTRTGATPHVVRRFDRWMGELRGCMARLQPRP